jgi:hypothetical protein
MRFIRGNRRLYSDVNVPTVHGSLPYHRRECSQASSCASTKQSAGMSICVTKISRLALCGEEVVVFIAVPSSPCVEISDGHLRQAEATSLFHLVMG